MRLASSEALGLFYMTWWYVLSTENDNSNFILKQTSVNEEQQQL